MILFDIGGGSSELVRLGRSTPTTRGPPLPEIEAWASLPVGVVTLAERYGGIAVTREIYEAMVDEVAAHVDRFVAANGMTGVDRIHLLGTSGTVTTIAGVHLDLQRYDRRRVDGCWMSEARSTRVVERLLAMSYEERVANACIGAERADLVLAGCAILDAIRRAFPCRRLRVADRGLREGMLVQMMRADGVWGTGRRQRGAGTVTARGSGRDLKVRVKTGKSRTLSSKLWLERQLNDPYVARAKREGFRSRAAYKLIEIDDKHRSAQARRAEWSISAPRPAAGARSRHSASVRRGQGPRRRHRSSRDGRRSPASSSCNSISSTPTAPDQLKELLGGPADVVLSDMAANATGHRKTDHICASWRWPRRPPHFAREVLAPGGAFLVQGAAGRHRGDAARRAQARLREREARQARREPRRFGGALSAGHRLSRRAGPEPLIPAF